MPSHQTAATDKKNETETSSEEETTSEEETSEEEEEIVEATKPSSAKDNSIRADYRDVGPRRSSRDDSNPSRGGYASPTYGRSLDDSKYPTTRVRPHEDDYSSRYGSGSSG